jgi:hypothetical protein
MRARPTPIEDTESAKAVAVPGVEKPTASSPPTRFSPAAKEAWASTPDEVRADVSRMEREFHAGAKYKTAAERDASLAEFHARAAKGNTTVKEALSRYVEMEDLLHADTVKGLELICKNAGVSLRDIATKYLGHEESATILELRNEIAELKSCIAEHQQQKSDSTTEAVTKFASDPAHPRFEELTEDIVFFLESGRADDLAEAYELAERFNPAPVEADLVGGGKRAN